ncbi:MAG: hypothetical protein A2798_00125 [Candidatus Levybacteria bacterium RIFCSPHIGHO2_01_FULL_37_17]|nr:MAG: hypothetical protein A2798_00125 [Candidatus Levybacteria bacterium RIFCSPHIGHO2_01_FULL_37_17]OGH36498.1 MAG: hypothetical protein A2959_03240 [Candidatus Levybacteria bacterium RIFCSPLOWO2_01_FULL_38_23]
MLGRRIEEQSKIRIYTEEDVTKAMLNFTGHDIKPPDDLIVSYVPYSSLKLKPWKEIEAMNAENALRLQNQPVTIFEAPRPMLEAIRSRFRKTALVFLAGNHR